MRRIKESDNVNTLLSSTARYFDAWENDKRRSFSRIFTESTKLRCYGL